MAEVFRDADCDLGLIRGKKVAVLGYGSQGRAQAMNLRDSGANVRVGIRSGSTTPHPANLDGFETHAISEAVKEVDFVLFALPDTEMGKVYAASVRENLSSGGALIFAHGFAIHYDLISPPNDVDVVLVAPMGAGPIVRRRYEEGSGVPGLLAVQQDVSGAAWAHAKAFGSAIGCGRVSMLATTFREETESDLFGEQAVLCGGLPELIRASFETAVAGGISPEIAYIACLHEVKLIADLIYERGLDGMASSISSTAAWGGAVNGPAIIGTESRAALQAALDEIKSGRFAQNWIVEAESGSPNLKRMLDTDLANPIHQVGRRVRQAFRL